MSQQNSFDQNKYAHFQDIYYTHYRHMLRYAHTIFSNRGANNSSDGRAEDAVQEAFVYAWEHYTEMYTSPNPEGWLFKVLFYKVLDRIKSDNKWGRTILYYEHLSAHSAYSTDLFESTDIQSLVAEEDYNLLKKLYLEGYSYREICHEYNITKAALGCRIHRIKKKILSLLIDPDMHSL